MDFLIDADLPRRAALLIRSYGHAAVDARDVTPPIPLDEQIAAYAKEHGECLVSCDGGFGDVRRYPPGEFAGIVVLQPGKDATAAQKLTLIQSLLTRPDLLAKLPGRLAVVSPNRVRIRPK